MTRMNFPLQRNTLPAVVLRKAGHTVYQLQAPFPPQWFREDVLCLFLLLLSLAFVPLVVPQAIHAETIVSGEVSGVWDVDGSPYLVTDTLIVPEGDTLLIEPGVAVIFQDQDSTQLTPFFVNGTLLAEGTEGDSITFSGAEYPYYGFILNHAEMVLDYCVVTDFSEYITCLFSATTFRNSRLDAEHTFLYNSSSGTDIFSNVSIRRRGEPLYVNANINSSDSLVLHELDAPGFYGHITACAIDTISDNSLKMLSFYDTDVVVVENQLEDASVSESTVEFINNAFSSGIYAWHSYIDVTNNMLSGICLDENYGAIIHNNYFDPWPSGGIRVWLGGSADIRYNNLNLIQISHHADVSIVNNTFYFDYHGVEGSDLENVEIINNIFLAREDTSVAIYSGRGQQPGTISYNCFYGMDEATNDLNLDEGNMFENPFLAGGNPFDYHLQANSPCIDAAAPGTPNDPDSTAADMGCFFYDQTIDNPPVLTTPQIPILQTGSPLSIEITATDDNGPLDFSFPDLPEWLTEEDELDWVSDTIIVSGTIPDSSRDFSFTVIAEDGLGQTDTAIVSVDVDNRTLLRGEISGILHVEDSPFYVVDDIIVPEGDSLTIEPGCELRFRNMDNGQRIGLDVYGLLYSQGTASDSIIYRSDGSEPDNYDLWNGIEFHHCLDTTQFCYTRLEYAYKAIHAVDTTMLVVNNCVLKNNMTGIFLQNESTIYVNSTSFIYNGDDIFDGIASQYSTVYIDDSIFISENNDSQTYNIYCFYSNIYINNTLFLNGWADMTNNCYVEVDNCMFKYLVGSMGMANNSSGVIRNCLFYNQQEEYSTGLTVYSNPIIITNNIFHGLEKGICLRAYSNSENLPVVQNNLFINNIYGIHLNNTAYPDVLMDQAYYNCFFQNDTLIVNGELDSTNLFIDPLLADTTDYFLFDISPLIDAGNPDSTYNDVDGTRNDIGRWGGPYGVYYEYPLWVTEQPDELPKTFELFAPYPNPFNSYLTIHYCLPLTVDIHLTICNILGQRVFTETYSSQQAGYHHMVINAAAYSSGMYFVELAAGKEVRRTKVVLLK